MTALARSDDPWTSWAAALSIDVKPSQQCVLWLLGTGRIKPLFALEDLEHTRVRLGLPFSPSRMRSAVAELVDNGTLEDSGMTSRTQSGRAQRLIRQKGLETLW